MTTPSKTGRFDDSRSRLLAVLLGISWLPVAGVVSAYVAVFMEINWWDAFCAATAVTVFCMCLWLWFQALVGWHQSGRPIARAEPLQGYQFFWIGSGCCLLAGMLSLITLEPWASVYLLLALFNLTMAILPGGVYENGLATPLEHRLVRWPDVLDYEWVDNSLRLRIRGRWLSPVVTIRLAPEHREPVARLLAERCPDVGQDVPPA